MAGRGKARAGCRWSMQARRVTAAPRAGVKFDLHSAAPWFSCPQVGVEAPALASLKSTALSSAGDSMKPIQRTQSRQEYRGQVMLLRDKASTFPDGFVFETYHEIEIENE